MRCEYCNQEKELRPYGRNGAMICFQCMKSTPESEAEAKRQFLGQLDACGGQHVVIGEQVGPYPLKNNPTLSEAIKKGGAA